MLDRNAFGNYRQLLYEITLNPAMGNYLDIARQHAGRIPNENYAREVLQLFSIGTVLLNQDGTPQLDATGQPIPTYTQDDGQQLRARVHRLATGDGADPGRAELHRSDGGQLSRSTTSARRRC